MIIHTIQFKNFSIPQIQLNNSIIVSSYINLNQLNNDIDIRYIGITFNTTNTFNTIL